MKQSAINWWKLGQKVDINSIEMFHACLEYNAKLQPKIKLELVKWPIYLEYWKYLENYQNIIPFTIKTTIDNITLRGDFIKSPIKNHNNDKIMILLHGITNTRFWIFKQAYIFLQNGYNIIWYDARNHGESDSSPTTFGLKEAHDLQDIINYANENYQFSALGLYGFSLGGATIITWSEQYQKYDINQKVKLLIPDSSFSRLDRAYYEKLNNYAFLPTNLMLNWVRNRAQKVFGVEGIENIQPIKYLKLIPNLPALFLHGINDGFIFYQNAHELYAEKIRYESPIKSSLYLVHEANHGQIFLLGDLNITITNEHDYPINTTISKLVLEFIGKWINP